MLCDIGALRLRLTALACRRAGEHDTADSVAVVPPKKRPKTPNPSTGSFMEQRERLLQQQGINLKVFQELARRLLNHLCAFIKPRLSNCIRPSPNAGEHSKRCPIDIGLLQRLINVHLHAQTLCDSNPSTISGVSMDSLEPRTLQLLTVDEEALIDKACSAAFRECVLQHVWHLLQQGFISASSRKRLDLVQVKALAAIAERLGCLNRSAKHFAFPVFFRDPNAFIPRMLLDPEAYRDMGALVRIIQLTVAMVQARLQLDKCTTGLVRATCTRGTESDESNSPRTATGNSCEIVDLPCRFVNICVWLANRASKQRFERTAGPLAAAVKSAFAALFGNRTSLQFCNRACGLPPTVVRSEQKRSHVLTLWALPRPAVWVAFELLRMESTTARDHSEGGINDFLPPSHFDEWVCSAVDLMTARGGSAKPKQRAKALYAVIRVLCLGMRERAIAARWNQPQLMFLYRVINIALDRVEASSPRFDASASSADDTGCTDALLFCLEKFRADFCDESNAGSARMERRWQRKSLRTICRLFARATRSCRAALSCDAATRLLSAFETHFLSLQPWPPEVIALVAEAAIGAPAHNRPQHVVSEIVMGLVSADAAEFAKYSDLNLLPVAGIVHRLTRAADPSSNTCGNNISPVETPQDAREKPQVGSSFAVTACVLHWSHHQLWRAGLELTTVDDAADSPRCRTVVKAVLDSLPSVDALLGIACSCLGFSTVETCAASSPANAPVETQTPALQFTNADHCWTHPRANMAFQIFLASAIVRHSPSVLLQLLTAPSLSALATGGPPSPRSTCSKVVISADNDAGVCQLTRLFHILLLVGSEGVVAAFRSAPAPVQRNMTTVFSAGASLLGQLRGSNFGPCENLLLLSENVTCDAMIA